MNQQPFKKFIHKKSNAAIKEEFRQEKRKAKKERSRRYQEHLEAVGKQRPDARRQKKDHTKSGPAPDQKKVGDIFPMPLNKYLSHCGVASRRQAADIVREGVVRVNGKEIIEPAFKVHAKDEVSLRGKKLSIVRSLVYILLNKPKDFITTTADPSERKTVIQLIKRATTERVYPVGRLDRNTTGLLLITNDGELTQKLTHPSFEVKKIYEVKLDKPLDKAHFEEILKGIQLDDGPIRADALAYTDIRDKQIIGVEIHSGRNRIVRRIFEHFGYRIVHLDRVMYAGLTKKDVERGKWRYLSESEIRKLRQLKGKNKSTKKPQ